MYIKATSLQVVGIILFNIPYTYKFSRYVNFAVDIAKHENLILEFYSPVTCNETREDMEEWGVISTFDLTSEIHGYHVYKEI